MWTAEATLTLLWLNRDLCDPLVCGGHSALQCIMRDLCDPLSINAEATLTLHYMRRYLCDPLACNNMEAVVTLRLYICGGHYLELWFGQLILSRRYFMLYPTLGEGGDGFWSHIYDSCSVLYLVSVLCYECGDKFVVLLLSIVVE
jgi:hypothetical protein